MPRRWLQNPAAGDDVELCFPPATQWCPGRDVEDRTQRQKNLRCLLSAYPLFELNVGSTRGCCIGGCDWLFLLQIRRVSIVDMRLQRPDLSAARLIMISPSCSELFVPRGAKAQLTLVASCSRRSSSLDTGAVPTRLRSDCSGTTPQLQARLLGGRQTPSTKLLQSLDRVIIGICQERAQAHLRFKSHSRSCQARSGIAPSCCSVSPILLPTRSSTHFLADGSVSSSPVQESVRAFGARPQSAL